MTNASISLSPLDTQAGAYGALLLRGSLGAMWIAHALLKVFVFTPAGTVQFFQSVGLPGGLAYLVIAVELIGGAAILLGIYARQLSLLMLPILLGAAWVHWPNGWVFTAKNGGWEYPAYLAVTSLAQWLVGDGALALKRSGVLVPLAGSGR